MERKITLKHKNPTAEIHLDCGGIEMKNNEQINIFSFVHIHFQAVGQPNENVYKAFHHKSQKISKLQNHQYNYVIGFPDHELKYPKND